MRPALFFKLMSGLRLGSYLVLIISCNTLFSKFDEQKKIKLNPELLSAISKKCVKILFLTKKINQINITLLHEVAKNGNNHNNFHIRPMIFLAIHYFLIDQPDNDDNTPLMLAVKNNNIKWVEMFTKYGKADVNKGDKYGNSPIHIATQHGFLNVLQLLLSDPYILIHKRDLINQTAFSIAFRQLKDYPEVFNLLKEHIKPTFDESCPICLFAIPCDDSVFYLTRCAHFFHKRCIKQWQDEKRKHNRICPFHCS